MAKWNEAGILRKKVIKDKHEDLLVFGYACKLFRDDEKALYIDQGKHLIPWMGQETLKIDRYDCRGALSELIQYEATREDYDAKRWLGLNESERRIEMLCDEERYYALKNNEEELEMYKEEELKRLHQKGSEFQYNYDVPTDPENSQEVPESVEEDDEVFVPPTELNVPPEVQVPKSVKENARIEKTASFVSKQGLQMEILIKTKQADNPQFDFMYKESPLYAYYKHVLAAIKSGDYKVHTERNETEGKSEETAAMGENEEGGHVTEEHYLHPSLFATAASMMMQQQSSASPTPPLPTVIYKPSADCLYSQLVNRIQGATHSEPSPSVTASDTIATTTVASELPQQMASYEQQQQYYQQYYYAAQYYEYYKQMAAHQFQGTAKGGGGGGGEDFTSNNASQAMSAAAAAYAQYLQSSNNSYAQIVSNLSHNNKECCVVPNEEIAKAPVLYGRKEATPPPPPPPPAPQPVVVAVSEKIIKNPLLPLADYGSDSNEEEEEEENNDDENHPKKEDEIRAVVTVEIKVPPDETQQIIDKMASYVAKNGKDFENIVRSKGDARFEFLDVSHVYHSYYLSMIEEFNGAGRRPNLTKTAAVTMTVPENGGEDPQRNGNITTNSKLKEKKPIAPVSFSIKKPKDEQPKEIKSALLMEESDDDREEGAVSNPGAATLPSPHNNNNSTPPVDETPPTSANTAEITTEIKQETEENNETAEKPKPTLDSDELILEMIDLTSDIEERRESKRAEDRKKDKITAAVREKLALQLERKKKAAAFLKLKSAESSKTVETPNSDAKIEKPASSASKTKENKESSSSSSHSKRERSGQCKNDEENSESEEGEIRKHRKRRSSKKKKSHKRKRSRSRHRSKSRHKSKEHKKSKKKRKRSESCSSRSSASAQ